MAAGKNVAASILERHGFAAVDADVLAHQALAQSDLQAAVIRTFAPYAAAKNIALTAADGSLFVTLHLINKRHALAPLKKTKIQ